jgi:hypothetical protein
MVHRKWIGIQGCSFCQSQTWYDLIENEFKLRLCVGCGAGGLARWIVQHDMFVSRKHHGPPLLEWLHVGAAVLHPEPQVRVNHHGPPTLHHHRLHRQPRPGRGALRPSLRLAHLHLHLHLQRWA